MSRQSDRSAAIAWAKELMASDPRSWCILDSETSGLGSNVEILQIGILWPDGHVALDALMEPDWQRIGGTIPEGATAIHGITDTMVKGCPTFPDMLPVLDRILSNRKVVIFNKGYDKPVIDRCVSYYSLCEYNADNTAAIGNYFEGSMWLCAMLVHAQFVGEPGRFGGGYRWQKLPDGGYGAHSAIADCKSTLDVIRMMAAAE